MDIYLELTISVITSHMYRWWYIDIDNIENKEEGEDVKINESIVNNNKFLSDKYVVIHLIFDAKMYTKYQSKRRRKLNSLNVIYLVE